MGNVVSVQTKVDGKMIAAIWSVSILINLTGLAITPSLPAIQKQFSGVGRTEIDMLVSLPMLLMIPFVVIAGKLVQSRNAARFIQIGTTVFIAAAVAYQLANTIDVLLLISLLLGLGAGMVVPLAAQLPSRVFTGLELQRQMGICAGISNSSQVAVTFLAGWLATISWHYSFGVYLLAVVPLVLSPFLRLKSLHKEQPSANADSTSIPQADTSWFNKEHLVLLMLLYFTVMFFNLQIPICLPFLLAHHGLNTETGGTLVAIFFMVQAVSAFFISNVIRSLRKKTMVFAVTMIATSLLLFPLVTNEIFYYILAALAGITGGIIEPLVWNKTAKVASPQKSTLAFGWLMSANYFSVWATPYILAFFSKIFNDDLSTFPFYLAGAVAIAFAIFLLFSQNKAIFGMKNEVALLNIQKNK